ncbi:MULTISPECIES: prepilin peptidase [Rhodomicrobium]|uniref:A24 family peptidase n=1 Tax=Rhodomicrobium TaxID=1068 RepID=UPI000B4C1809|nr:MULTISPECIES: prepilin peptidase [Rhodomicrobium]
MNQTVQFLFAATFVVSVMFAMVSDFSRLRIPNSVSIVLVAAFAAYALLGGVAHIWLHLMLAGGVFALLFGFFALGWLGAGDVKFLSALMLWAGPGQGVSFIVLFAVFGGALAMSLLALRRALPYYPILSELPVLSKFSRWARNGLCPYGIPIGLAALCVAPAIFAIH